MGYKTCLIACPDPARHEADGYRFAKQKAQHVSSGYSNPQDQRVKITIKQQEFSAFHCPRSQVFQQDRNRRAGGSAKLLPVPQRVCEGKIPAEGGNGLAPTACTKHRDPSTGQNIKHQRAGSIPSAFPLPCPEARGTRRKQLC